jgi:hypothetical protein
MKRSQARKAKKRTTEQAANSIVVDQDDAVLKRNDCVEIASIDSFPASDPPGWICTAAKWDGAVETR